MVLNACIYVARNVAQNLTESAVQSFFYLFPDQLNTQILCKIHPFIIVNDIILWF